MLRNGEGWHPDFVTSAGTGATPTKAIERHLVRLYFSPKSDPIFLGLKQIAVDGQDLSPFCARGILAVIDQIETLGRFQDDPITLVWEVQRDLVNQTAITTVEERILAEQMAHDRGWTLEQTSEYAHGVLLAETNLAKYNIAGNDVS